MEHQSIRTIVLGMGCFWTPEALFGQYRGVLRTQTGYAGGTTVEPNYRNMGDHTEVVQVSYDPEVISLEDLLEVFQSHHKPSNINGYKGRQYQSLLLAEDSGQERLIHEFYRRSTQGGGGAANKEEETEIGILHRFYPAEERHQKYYLKRFPAVVAKLDELYPSPDVRDSSTVASRLNALAKGFINLRVILQELDGWQLSEVDRIKWKFILRGLKW